MLTGLIISALLAAAVIYISRSEGKFKEKAKQHENASQLVRKIKHLAERNRMRDHGDALERLRDIKARNGDSK